MSRGRFSVEAVARAWLWGWPAIGQLTLDLLLAMVYLMVPLLALIGIVTIPALLIGLPLLVLALVCAIGLSWFERARVFALTGMAIATPLPMRDTEPIWRRLLLRARSWRALLHLTAISLWGLLAGSVITVLTSVALAAAAVPTYAMALPDGPDGGLHLPFGGQIDGFWWLLLVFGLGILGLVVVPLLARGLVLVDVLLARYLLGPGRNEQVERLSERVDTLTQTREATVDSVEVERRRIERDLHDGPQQRLVAIAMDLGMAQERIDRDPAGARQLLNKAHAASKEAITEMRMVARGIHPPVLTDRGLDAALSALAARSPVPVTVQVDLPTRPSPTVEAIAYFCVSEALTNVAKHARATSARVEVTAAGSGLRIEIRDDGVGGANPAGGTGLHGLTDRVRAIDGSMDVTSPIGGPTVLSINLPWSRS
ncbi:MAG TPA: sensor histidine kinase [Kineosporiaceae bacterium]|nr:sensor histidine kinase [Kineosporiaceae bacterium]